MVFLKLIFAFLLIGVIVVFLVVWGMVRQVRNVAQQFRQKSAGEEGHKVNGNVIYDRRSPAQAKKQIIPDDEGEYVDYE